MAAALEKIRDPVSYPSSAVKPTVNMKAFRSPDFMIVTIVAIALVVIILLIAWPLRTTVGWRIFLLTIIPVFQATFSLFWISWPRLRITAYRCYYSVLGPRCDVQVLGRIIADPTLNPREILGKAHSIARNWRSDSEEVVRISNRSVIRAGPRTLTVDVRTSDESTDDDSELDEKLVVDGEEQIPCHHEVTFNLGGYDSKLTRMDSLLHREILSLLEQFANGLIVKGTEPNFTVRVHIHGDNPFLAFYLRDVPLSRVSEFELQLIADEYGNPVHISVRSDLITVAARSPSALVESARRYLATPGLSNLN